MLNRMTPILDEAGIPQLTQAAYRKNVSCTDFIFASHEVFSKKESATTYDFISAHCTVEFCVLLESEDSSFAFLPVTTMPHATFFTVECG